MKKQIFALLVGLTIAAPNAFAALTSAQVLDISKIAVLDFETVNPDHAPHFTGFKAWKSGADGKVKIYVDHDGHAMEFNYLCHVHDGATECHAQ